MNIVDSTMQYLYYLTTIFQEAFIIDGDVNYPLIDTIIGIGVILTTLIFIIFVWRQIQEQRRQLEQKVKVDSANIILQFVDVLRSEDFRDIRFKILRGTNIENKNQTYANVLGRYFTHFAFIGILSKNKTIDIDVVLQFFNLWICEMKNSSHIKIELKNFKKTTPEFYNNLIWLFNYQKNSNLETK